jgi:hypothetical protein
MTQRERVYRCDRCGRRLRRNRWVYSKHEKKRYCRAGEGCFGKPV